MSIINNLAAILHKAQHRIDIETGKPIDVGAEVLSIRREYDELRTAAQAVVDRLERALEGKR